MTPHNPAFPEKKAVLVEKKAVLIGTKRPSVETKAVLVGKNSSKTTILAPSKK